MCAIVVAGRHSGTRARPGRHVAAWCFCFCFCPTRRRIDAASERHMNLLSLPSRRLMCYGCGSGCGGKALRCPPAHTALLMLCMHARICKYARVRVCERESTVECVMCAVVWLSERAMHSLTCPFVHICMYVCLDCM